MLRKDLLHILTGNPMTVAALARLLAMKPAEVADDLEHLFKSVRHTEHEAVVDPAVCKKCGFAFSPETLRKPSKCPECKGSWIADPKISFRLGNGKDERTR
ncbi:MAG TPA: transcriptional regulator [Methylomirabilota bacterium]|nr:transcriptional regulator [Methylomirabilota bacterium]